MIAAWNRFFHQPADARIPALIRIGYACLVLINLSALYPNLELWFGEGGVLPRQIQHVRGYQWTVLDWIPAEPAALQFCFWIFVLQAVCLLLGLSSRFSATCVFIWLMSFQHRNQLILDGEDKVLRLMGFFLIFMPLAEVWSMDAWLFRRDRPADERCLSKSSPWAWRTLQIFMTLIMFATGLWKFAGESWRDGTALYYVARIDDLFGRFPVPHYLFDTPWTVRAMTWSVLYVELAIPFLIWIPKARRFSLLVLLAFHLSNEWAMHLFLFHWIMLCGWMSFLKKEDLDAAARLWRRISGSRSADVPRALPATK